MWELMRAGDLWATHATIDHFRGRATAWTPAFPLSATPKGLEYFFLPSIPALKYLATL